MKTIIEFEFQSRLVWNVFRGRSGMWVGVCDPLGLTVQGETWAEMTEAGNEALELLLIDLIETGDIKEFLVKHGWRPTLPLPVKIEEMQVAFNVPMFFETADGAHCRA